MRVASAILSVVECHWTKNPVTLSPVTAVGTGVVEDLLYLISIISRLQDFLPQGLY
jgi:hypothetical protein